MIKKIERGGETFAIIFTKNSEIKQGHNFITSPAENLQVNVINEKAGKIIPNHIHNPIERKIIGTQEVLYVEKGILKIKFLTETNETICEKILRPGDFAVLLRGGHGFEFLEDSKIIYVKQGPYVNKKLDKKVFGKEQ